ncbi:MAG TPA: outer membrane lipoprotein LolB [Chromatiales bacterium]|nr:outer membrane lipoprotein LolB [Chromatiales bacterium]
MAPIRNELFPMVVRPLFPLISSRELGRLSCGLFVLLLIVLVTGCASHPVAPVVTSEVIDQRWAAHHAQLSKLSGWELGGRIAVKSAQDSWSANLHWQQRAAAFDVRFSSLLGLRIAQLKGDALSASLYLPDNRVLSAANLSELLDDELGWSVPVAGLRYWLVGLPAPAIAAQAIPPFTKGLDELGRLQWLEQSGWRIDYQRYRSAGTLALPQKMVLTRDDLRVRLVIDRWQTAVAPRTMVDAAARLSLPRLK